MFKGFKELGCLSSIRLVRRPAKQDEAVLRGDTELEWLCCVALTQQLDRYEF